MSVNPFGHFDDARREYVITRPDTPLPWINYLGCEDFFGIISNTAGGYSFYRDARLRRLTRYRYNNVPLDSNGRYLYVRDGGTVWNPSWKPCRVALDRYECRHGMGYTQISGDKDSIAVTTRYFVPLGQTCEVWDVRVRNTGASRKRIQLWGFVEWCLWDAQDDATNFQRNFSTGQVEVEPQAIYHVTEYRERRNHFAYFVSSVPTQGFDTCRDSFVGVHEGLDAPRAVVAGRCTGSIAHGWRPIGAHQIELDLAPGEQRRCHFLLGYAENPADRKFATDPAQGGAPRRVSPGQLAAEKAPVDQVRSALGTPDAVDGAFEALGRYWNDLLSVYSVEIADPHVSRMVNVWNQYQCMVTLNLSRSASMFESGIGRGMGYRDSNQDLLGVVHLQPERSRQRLLDLAATQLSDGTCFHQYQPLTKKGNAYIGGGFNDDPLWLPLAVYAYLSETGDAGILEARCPYADNPDAPANLVDHLELSMAYTLKNRGPHGLPLIGHADWNDCLNLNCFSVVPGESFQCAGDIEGSVAESVMIAGLFCFACERMAGIYRMVGRERDAAQSLEHRTAVQAAIDAAGWDGNWFLRAYDAAGRKVGSKTCDEGQIFIESQGWCVLGGVGLTDGRARRALDSVRERLATPNGIVLQQPAYSTYHVELGEVSSYPPGYKENAGIFTHNNTWIQCAEALLGNGDQAFAYYLSICPSRKEEQIETYRCEPYVYSQMTAGPDAPTPGEAKNAFLTGTAAWSFIAISQYILGVTPSPDGLVVDPCIPQNWKGFTVKRRFRGRMYLIEVRNPKRVQKGVRRLQVDGKEIQGHTIPLDLGGATVRVVAELG
ncbi:MAG: glycosyl transferase [Planctomycetota bacterium]|nr:glycosyl transferase [Planctomycetota bacterium]